MSIKAVKTDELRRMNGKEGLVLQGCGGDPQEWLDGINDLLTDEGILKNGSKFENSLLDKSERRIPLGKGRDGFAFVLRQGHIRTGSAL